MTLIRFLIGVTAFAAGVWLLAGLPLVPTWTALSGGWLLTVAGIALAAGAALDLIGVD